MRTHLRIVLCDRSKLFVDYHFYLFIYLLLIYLFVWFLISTASSDVELSGDICTYFEGIEEAKLATESKGYLVNIESLIKNKIIDLWGGICRYLSCSNVYIFESSYIWLQNTFLCWIFKPVWWMLVLLT